MKRWMTWALAFGTTTALLAADGGEFAAAQAQVKEKYPAEYAEVQKLAATDLAAAMEKLRALAKQGNVKLPRSRTMRGNRSERGNRGPRGGFDDGMPPEMPGGRGERGERGERRGRPQGGMNFAASVKSAAAIKEQFPQDYAAVTGELKVAEDKYEALAVKAGAENKDPIPRTLRQLEQKNPAEFDAAAKLMKDNMREGMLKLSALAEKEGVRLGPARRSGEDAPAFSGTQSRVDPRRRMRELRARYPEEMRKIDELRRTDPEAARKQLQELNKKYDAATSAAGEISVRRFELHI